jgi:putative ABC transport system substrate-binding protein
MGKAAHFIVSAVLLLALFALPGIARAERTVAVILTGAIPYYEKIDAAFNEELRRLGMSGEVRVLTQKPAPNKMAWSNSARKAVAVGSDVIVAYGGASAAEVLAQTSKIPVVYAGVFDPQALGLKGKNCTGISSKVPIAGVLKNLKAIKEFGSLGVIYNSAEKDTVVQAREVSRLAGQFGFEVVEFNVRSLGDIVKIEGVDALFVSTSCTAHLCVSGIVDRARELKAPTATPVSGGEEAGVVLTIYASAEEQGRTAARMVAKILEGGEPSSLPAEAPREIEMVVNLRETRKLGLKIPMDVLMSATRVVK